MRLVSASEVTGERVAKLLDRMAITLPKITEQRRAVHVAGLFRVTGVLRQNFLTLQQVTHRDDQIVLEVGDAELLFALAAAACGRGNDCSALVVPPVSRVLLAEHPRRHSRSREYAVRRQNGRSKGCANSCPRVKITSRRDRRGWRFVKGLTTNGRKQ